MAANVLEHEHHHVQFGERLEDERFAPANRSQTAARKWLEPAALSAAAIVFQKRLQALEADDVPECMGRLLELHDIVAQLALDELLHFGDDLVQARVFFSCRAPFSNCINA